MSEHKVGLANALLHDSEMKRIDLDGTALVLIRRGTDYYAIGAVCPHYGAPLENGILKAYTLMCPWHHACVDIRQGSRREPPALNDLPHFPVRIEQGQVIVTLPQGNTSEPYSAADASDKRHFIIVGVAQREMLTLKNCDVQVTWRKLRLSAKILMVRLTDLISPKSTWPEKLIRVGSHYVMINGT